MIGIRRIDNIPRDSGFTLVELMVALALGLIVMLAVGFIFATSSRSSHENLKSSTLEQDLNAIMDIMASELRRAGFWDHALINPPVDHAYLNGDYNHLDLVSSSCVLYFYDADEGHDVDDDEMRGFKLNDTTKNIMMRRSCTVTSEGTYDTCMSDCDAGSWGALNDDDLVEITGLTLTSTGSRCLNLSNEATRNRDYWDVTNTAATEFRCPCTNDTDITFYSYVAGPPASYTAGSCATDTPATDDRVISIRQVNITIQGETEGDAAISKQITTTVKVANDHVTEL